MILIDTHIVAWLAFDPAKISPKAATAIREARIQGEGVAICDITLVELAVLVARNRIQLPISLETFLAEVEALFVVLPITARACARAMVLDRRFPKDLADRIIAGTALAEGRTLITADRAILRSQALPTLW